MKRQIKDVFGLQLNENIFCCPKQKVSASSLERLHMCIHTITHVQSFEYVAVQGHSALWEQQVWRFSLLFILFPKNVIKR